MPGIEHKKSGKENFRGKIKTIFPVGRPAMVVATKTSVDDLATVVGGMYDGHFGHVRGYM